MPMCFIQVFDGIGEGSCDASLSEVRQYFVGLNFHVVLPAAAFTELASSFTTNSDGRIEWQVRFLGFHPSCSGHSLHLLIFWAVAFPRVFHNCRTVEDRYEFVHPGMSI
jgi:hypothetical protein